MGDIKYKVECGESEIGVLPSIRTVRSKFYVKVFKNGEFSKSDSGENHIDYDLDMKTLSFWNDVDYYGQGHLIPFSKIEEFRNWLIANGYED